ncbi:hypothetical protein A2U01_0052572, partial [Trifolium medium]|nr:hypothetical protein [Trifolium medium]
MVRSVGNGSSTYFWLSRWIGDAPLSLVYPRLFSLSLQKESMVGSCCAREGENWSWPFSWRRELFQWESDLVVQLRERLEVVRLSSEMDSWRWVPDSEGIFSVNSTYNHLRKELRDVEVLEEE